MARRRNQTDEDEAREQLLELARRLAPPGPGELAVLIVRGEVRTIHPQPSIVRAGQVPEGMSAYDAAILGATTDNAMSAERLARAAGHRNNSYFRERLAAIVEAGHIQHTRRGYRLPGR